MVLKWPLSHLHTVADSLDPWLEPVGLRLFRYNDRIGLRSLDQQMLDTARELTEMHDPDRGLSLPPASLLHLVYRGELGTRNLPRGYGPRLQQLLNLNTIHFDPSTTGRAELTDAAAFSFQID